MPRMIFRLAAVLILAASQVALGECAFARGGSSGVSHGHFVGSSHFSHGRFGHRFRRKPIFIAPYGWDWPYADYEAPSAGYNTTIVAYPPPLNSGRAADNCHWDEETFTVPSSAGGTSPVKVMSCR